MKRKQLYTIIIILKEIFHFHFKNEERRSWKKAKDAKLEEKGRHPAG